MSLGVVFAGFVILLFLGAPIAAAMALPAIAYFIAHEMTLSVVCYTLFNKLFNFQMLAIPMFILMGNLVNAFEETERGFAFARQALRGKKGYSAKVNVIISLVFAGMSGAALADVGGLGNIEIRAMEREGYSRDYGAALTIATSVVGPIFPPSIPLVLYAMVAELSSARCLIAGMLPGVLISACLLVFVILHDKKIPTLHEDPLTEEEKSPAYKRKVFLDALPIMLCPVIIIICMLGGVLSPGETGALACVYAIGCGVFHKTFTWKKVWDACMDTLKSCSAILLVIFAGDLLSKVFTLEALPQKIINLLGGVAQNQFLLLIIINLLLLVLGMIMESNSIIILTTPIILALTEPLGLDSYAIGVMLVYNVMIGLCTPPFGMCLFAGAKTAGISVDRVVKEVVPMYVPLLVALLLITFVPQISTFIPNLLFS